MSMELHVLFNEPIALIQEWQRAITAIGFDLVLDPKTDVQRQSGFLPARYSGVSTGFEFGISSALAVIESYGTASLKGSWTYAGNFRWGGDLMAMASAAIAAAGLTRARAGLLYDPQEDAVYGPAGAVEYALEATRAVPKSSP
jgi:hypothetical protein